MFTSAFHFKIVTKKIKEYLTLPYGSVNSKSLVRLSPPLTPTCICRAFYSFSIPEMGRFSFQSTQRWKLRFGSAPHLQLNCIFSDGKFVTFVEATSKTDFQNVKRIELIQINVIFAYGYNGCLSLQTLR